MSLALAFALVAASAAALAARLDREDCSFRATGGHTTSFVSVSAIVPSRRGVCETRSEP
jgi:hypothetical protein